MDLAKSLSSFHLARENKANWFHLFSLPFTAEQDVLKIKSIDPENGKQMFSTNENGVPQVDLFTIKNTGKL